MEQLLRPDNPVFAGYAFYSCILIIKMFLMSYLTALQRFRKKVSQEVYNLYFPYPLYYEGFEARVMYVTVVHKYNLDGLNCRKKK